MNTKLSKRLNEIGKRIGNGSTVRVGFLEDATYPAVDPGADRLLKGLDKLNSIGPFQKGGKPASLRKYRKSRKEKQKTFVGPASPPVILHVAQVAWWNNFGNARIPARPFFTNMILAKSPTWGTDLGKIFTATGYNSKLTLTHMGERIKDQLVKAIVDWPADNSPLTVAIKGFNKGLIQQGIMQRSVDSEVVSK